MKSLVFWLLTILFVLSSQSHAQWTKSVDCPEGHEYRDDRGANGAGGGEFCVLHLPGSLWVKDGPARWWFSMGNFGEEGLYQNGRKSGLWTECDRFNRCHQITYPLLYPEENTSRAEIPLSFVNGKYVFDFESCWRTWITRETDDSFLELNIGSGFGRCNVTIIPAGALSQSPGSAKSYICQLPQTLGVREFDSLDLRQELPRLGLPLFCRQDSEYTPDFAYEPPELGLAFWSIRPSSEGDRRSSIADLLDVECAAVIEEVGRPILQVRFNRFSEPLVLTGYSAATSRLEASACMGRHTLPMIANTTDTAGRLLLSFYLGSEDLDTKLGCITRLQPLQPSCLALP